MVEKDLNAWIRQVLEHHGFAEKFPDPPKAVALTASKRPFDGIGTWQGLPLAWEAKWLPKLESFNLKRLETHQWERLQRYRSALRVDNHSWVVLGLRESRMRTRVYVFDAGYAWMRFQAGRNFLAKELETLPYTLKTGKLESVEFTVISGDIPQK